MYIRSFLCVFNFSPNVKEREGGKLLSSRKAWTAYWCFWNWEFRLGHQDIMHDTYFTHYSSMIFLFPISLYPSLTLHIDHKFCILYKASCQEIYDEDVWSEGNLQLHLLFYLCLGLSVKMLRVFRTNIELHTHKQSNDHFKIEKTFKTTYRKCESDGTWMLTNRLSSKAEYPWSTW